MMMRRLIINSVLCCSLFSLSSCSDFFNPDNNSIKYGDEYIKEGSELYAGFIGVITKMQAIGDKAIYITDTRAELLEPTGNSTELYDIYNYESELQGNSYADPAAYYDVIISCNDYLSRAYEFKQLRPNSIREDHYKGLIAGILRLKVWTYFTMGKIYGQAVWFDDPMWSLKDFTDYPNLNLTQIIDACTNLLETGFDGVDATHEMSWTEWISQTDGSDVNSGDFALWDIMLPPYFALSAELSLWKGEWQRVVDLVQPMMNYAFSLHGSSSGQNQWMMSTGYQTNYSTLFDNLSPNQRSAISVINYNYEKDQTNTLLKHFYNDYMLRPSQVGADRYFDPEFNYISIGTNEIRYNNYIASDSQQRLYFHKYRKRSGSKRSNPKQDDVHIYTYRSTELYFMLIEAFNHLGRYDEMNALLNKGVNYSFPTGNIPWDGFTDDWTRKNKSYPDSGIRGVFGLPEREMLSCDSDENIMYNDIQILREIILDQPGEGKTYPAMLRMARRYNDYNIIADLVCPKYDVSKQEEIRSKILNGGYFVNWDINSLSSR